MFIRKNVGPFSRIEWPKDKHKTSDTASYPRKPEPTEKYPWITHILQEC
jgi:hypothetical protein